MANGYGKLHLKGFTLTTNKKHKILISGSAGVIGTAVRKSLEGIGFNVEGLDIAARGIDKGDVCDANRVLSAVRGCQGIVHLAAVSRVIWAERDPDTCWAANVEGTRNIIEAALTMENQPWLIFSSSREVFGQPDILPASEETPLRPINVYGRSKVEGERLAEHARKKGLRASIVRLSNVYGSIEDHVDRVIPAFARQAVEGKPLQVNGPDNTFDFTHIEDVTRGIVALIHFLKSGAAVPPPIHFLSGERITLGQLASLAVDLAGSDSVIEFAQPRQFDVSKFYGSFDRAKNLLGWKPRVRLKEGLARLIEDFMTELSVGRAGQMPPS